MSLARRSLARLASLAALLALAGCGGPPDDWTGVVVSGDARGFDVLLVTLDTVRRDRIGCYGDADAVTPVLDRLGENGVRFDDAVTAAPLTLPSHATLLTGLIPPRHGARDNGSGFLDESHTTLAETLRAQGYDTAAFVGCFVLDERFGLAQGFDRYDFVVSERGFRRRMPDFNERPADEVTDAAIEWLSSRDDSSPFFAWVHYFDAHLPYRSPLADEPRFEGRPYDAEIAFVDRELGRLLAALGDARDSTLIVVTADHGEALGEHDEPTHGLLLYDCTLRVPLLISCPALFPRGFVDGDRVVGLVDLKATIEDLAGIPSEPGGDGRSLLKPGPEDRAIYVETFAPVRLGGWSPLAGLRFHDAKLIVSPEPEYYDLTADPDERTNLWEPGHEAARLVAEVEDLRDTRGMERTLSVAEQERLEALGYVQSPPTAAEGPRPKPDPLLFNEALRAEELYAAQRYEEAAAVARDVVAKNPDVVQAVRVLAFSEVRLGFPNAAVTRLSESAERMPDPFLLRSLAQLLIASGQVEEAREVLDTYESVAPEDGRVPLLRGDCFVREGRPADARREYEEARRRDPHRVGRTADERIDRIAGGG